MLYILNQSQPLSVQFCFQVDEEFNYLLFGYFHSYGPALVHRSGQAAKIPLDPMAWFFGIELERTLAL
jgi:hypothetical protein